uniref:Sulfatase domain-containing protein n=1 Tax=Ascaris lumbricoides TaxID=6252 RepID=A0A0M3HNU6_ASCLU
MSFDYEKYIIILSQENRPYEMLIERLPLNDTEAGFKPSVVSVPKGMRKCRQLSDDVLCCFAEQLSKIGTHCFSQEQNTTRHLYERWMAPSNFWQTLQVDGTMVGVRRNKDYRILNTRTGG